MKSFSKFIYWLFGWKLLGEKTDEMKKCVIVVAPHTSQMDFVWGRLGLWILGINVRFLIKKESFVPVVGYFLKKLGGIPIDRGKKNNMVEQVVEEYRKHDEFAIVITAEGTRKLTHKWKKGFYEIALKANVPIVMAFVDYARKEGGVSSQIIYPSGNYEADLEKIQLFYDNIGAKYPENYHRSPMYRNNKETEK